MTGVLERRSSSSGDRPIAAVGGQPDLRSADAAGYERAAGLLFAGVAALAASGPISDNSLLTHVATGRLQASGGLPAENPFLVSSSDFPVPSWWWSGALGWAERLAGLGAVRIFTVVVAAILGYLLVRCSRPNGSSGVPASAAVTQVGPAALVLVVLAPWVNGRPQLGGFVLLAVALVIWRERHPPWWLVAVFGVWVNVHGTWLHGIAVLGLLWVVEVIDARSVRVGRLRFLVGVAGGVLVGGVFYPERFRLVLLPTEQLGSAQARAAIRVYHEWNPPGFSSPWVWVFAMLAGLALFGAMGSHAGESSWLKLRARPGSLVAVTTLTLMGLSALRLLPVAAIALGGFAAAGISRVSESGVPPVALRKLVGAFGVLALAGAGGTAWSAPHLDLSRFPVAETDWLAERGLVAADEVRLIQNDWVGNYLELRFGEEANVWVDDRPSVDTMLDYVRLRGLSEGWREALARADPDVVLWQAGDPLPGELEELPEWSTALTTDRFRVLCHARIASRCR